MEVCDTQAVLSLLDTGSVACSETFAFYGASEAVNAVNRELHAQHNKSRNLTSEGNKEEGQLGTEEEQLPNDDDYDQEEDNYDGMFNSEHVQSGTGQHGDCHDGPVDLALIGEFFGKAPLYNVVDKEKGTLMKVPVSYETHYRLRGKELSCLSHHEYSALIGLREKKTGLKKKSSPSVNEEDDLGEEAEENDRDNRRNPSRNNSLFEDECEDASADCEQENGEETKKKGRQKARLFPFGIGHPLRGKYVQFLKSKQPTLIFTGKARPRHPGPPPDEPEGRQIHLATRQLRDEHQGWKSKADKYAMCYLVAFRPEETRHCANNHNELLPLHTWEALCDWISELESDERLICKARLAALVNHVCYHATKTSQRKMMSAFRMRNKKCGMTGKRKKGLASMPMQMHACGISLVTRMTSRTSLLMTFRILFFPAA
jgi:hypothetical protein